MNKQIDTPNTRGKAKRGVSGTLHMTGHHHQTKRVHQWGPQHLQSHKQTINGRKTHPKQNQNYYINWTQKTKPNNKSKEQRKGKSPMPSPFKSSSRCCVTAAAVYCIPSKSSSSSKHDPICSDQVPSPQHGTVPTLKSESTCQCINTLVRRVRDSFFFFLFI